MEYQKIIRLLDNTPNQPTKFRTKKNRVEINDDARITYKSNSQIKLKFECQNQVYVTIVMHIYLLKEL